MPREFSRTQRVGEQIQQEIAALLQREVKDPRVGMVTCTGVEVSRDFAYAKVFVTLLGKDDDTAKIKETISVLNHAAGYLRTMLAKVIQIRTVPQLRFVYDESVVKGHRLQNLIDAAVARDEKNPDSDGSKE